MISGECQEQVEADVDIIEVVHEFDASLGSFKGKIISHFLIFIPHVLSVLFCVLCREVPTIGSPTVRPFPHELQLQLFRAKLLRLGRLARHTRVLLNCRSFSSRRLRLRRLVQGRQKTWAPSR